MKKLLVLSISALATAAIAIFAIAALNSPVTALTDHQSAAIVEYCSNIKQVLRVIQRDDSKERVAVGATYEIIVSRYITPLNLRLISNNIGDPALVSLQSDFITTQRAFSTKFIEYSRSFETLLASDCASSPDTFYARLEQTRALRAELHTLATELTGYARSVSTDVYNIQGTL